MKECDRVGGNTKEGQGKPSNVIGCEGEKRNLLSDGIAKQRAIVES